MLEQVSFYLSTINIIIMNVYVIFFLDVSLVFDIVHLFY